MAEPQNVEDRLKQLEEELAQVKAMKGGPPERQLRRVQFEFTEEAYDYLQREAAKTHGGSMASVMRDALSKKQWIDEAIEKGKLLIREEDGEVRRVAKI